MHTISQRGPFGPYAGVRRSPAAYFAQSMAKAVARLFEAVLIWQERDKQRRALAELDARMLKDLGLSWADVERELRKPFWSA